MLKRKQLKNVPGASVVSSQITLSARPLVMDPVNQRFCAPLQKFAKDTNKTQ
jgi:hypothetical protein